MPLQESRIIESFIEPIRAGTKQVMFFMSNSNHLKIYNQA